MSDACVQQCFLTALMYEARFQRASCLLNGLDDIGLTLEKADSIQSFEAKAAQERPWV